MNSRLTTLLGAVILVAGLVSHAQDEQSARSSPSGRFWTAPRVELNPSGTPADTGTPGGAAQTEPLTIDNDILEARWNPQSGQVTLTVKSSKRTFLTGGFNTSGGTAKVTNVAEKFGRGRAIEVSYPNGNRDVIMLFPKLPFALFRSSLHNGGSAHTLTRTVRPFVGDIDLGKPADNLKTFGTGGLMSVGANPGSYTWLAVADPETRNGVVFGWITQERGNGVLFSKVEKNAVRIGGQIDYGRLRLAPGKSEDLEMLAVGYFDDARLGLESWADQVAKYYDIKLREQPAGYCTWYSQPHGGAADETNLNTLAQFAAKELQPYGFSVVQIDDKWQAGFKRSSPSSPKKDFTKHDPDGPYPSGMKAAADKIKALGLVPGIWFMPFAGTSADPFFKDHLDWFVKDKEGKPYDTPWGGTCLDMTYDPARAHLRDVAGRICREWGYDYIKIDGLWTGTATKQLYVNSGYKEDDIGDAVFHNPDKTNIEVYRDGLKLLREAIGKDVFILGCNGPQNMRSYGGAFGLVDAMRVGPDNNSEWGRLTRGPHFGTRHYFLHGRVWLNDPDPVYVRGSMPLKHAQLICSWVAICGQLNLSSEWLPGLPPERLDILKRTMPGHGLLPRPADLFDNDMPSLWLVSDTKSSTRRDVIGVFNWNDAERNFDYPLDRLGLDAKTEYVAYDYWADALVSPMQGRLKVVVPAQSCAVLAVRPRAAHPQLISTSRHATQGIVDVIEEKWDAKTKTLSGRSRIIGGDKYELRILTPAGGSGWNPSQFSIADQAGTIEANFAQSKELIRATILSPKTREVNWAIKFE